MPKRPPPPDEIVEDLKAIIADIDVPEPKRRHALALLRIFTAKRMAQAQVRGIRIAKEELAKEK